MLVCQCLLKIIEHTNYLGLSTSLHRAPGVQASFSFFHVAAVKPYSPAVLEHPGDSWKCWQISWCCSVQAQTVAAPYAAGAGCNVQPDPNATVGIRAGWDQR